MNQLPNYHDTLINLAWAVTFLLGAMIILSFLLQMAMDNIRWRREKVPQHTTNRYMERRKKYGLK